VVTVHDLGYVYFPEAHQSLQRRYLEWSTRHSVKRATRVIADSLATATDLAAHYKVPQDRINVIYLGVDDALKPVTDPETLAEVRDRYGLPERYLLFMGTLQPRKNIARIVRGYAQWAASQPDPDVALVLAGQQGWLYDPTWTAGVGGVILPGYIHDEDIAALYSGAQALLLPSLYEGFGFPVAQAMAAGVPVVTSNVSSLPEVAGDGALLVDPRSPAELRNALDRLLSSPDLRRNLTERGREQAKRYRWSACAEKSIGFFRNL
jgi:glycosyltransferase involved in cell wall biosynthesis